MSNGALKLLAGAGAKDDPVYVDDVFSTFLYEGTGAALGIQNGINLGDFGVGTSTKFDHNVDFLSRSSDLTSNSDGKTFTFSCWVFLAPKIDDNVRTLYATDSNDNGVLFYIQSNNTLGMEAWNGGVRTLQLSTSTVIGTNVWTNILVSLDFANSSNRYIYFNDAAATVTYNTYNNANVEFTRPTHYIGIWGNGSTRGLHNDNLAHMYLDYTYRDLSTESNRRIFIDANGGSTSASSLTALNPIMYIPMTTAYAVGKNAGTGGDFTSNGSPTIVENGTEYVSGNGKGGMVWSKARDVAYDHGIMDTERGVSGGNLQTNENFATQVAPSGKDLTGFNSDGYSIGPIYTASYNNSGTDYVSWTFRKQEGFFDVVTYTGTGSAQNISHNLGSVPGCIIIKNTSNVADWTVYHRGVDASSPENYNLALNKTDARDDNVAYFNDTAPTSTVFTVNSDSTTNTNGDTYVAYLFAHDAQDFGENSDEAIIYCDSFTNDSSSVGVEVNVGFEPQWLLIKGASTGSGLGSWQIIDNMRNANLKPNSNAVESSTVNFDFTSRGFTPTTYYDGTLVYIAIRRPHKPASEFAATKLFNVDAGANTTPGFDTGFPVDMGIFRLPDSTSDFDIMTRLTGLQRLDFTAGTEANKGAMAQMDHMDGWSTSANNYRGWAWRRAPGYFDVVCWSGDNTNGRTLAHNLGVTPEMMWVKARTVGENWYVYHTATGATKAIYLNGTQAPATSVGFWNDTAPTSSVFSVYSAFTNSSSQTYIAYLFASVDGISKVGNYTGTGSDLNVDCGFSAGASFVLIRRTDSTGDWYVWDSVGGIVAGNDPYLLFNSDAAQVTNTDYIDPLSSGFTVTSSAPAGLNASSGTYIFYAIA